MTNIKIGTRGSNLALIQSKWIKHELEKKHPHHSFELVIIKTKGDKILDSPLSKIGDKGLFTKEIEDQLLDKFIDLAVHSMKDLPTVLPDGLMIGAATERLDPNDVLISKRKTKLLDLKPGATIATSSLRRKAQILSRFPEINIVDIRGNLNTRLRKLDESDTIDGIILAKAGIERLNFSDKIDDIIDTEIMIPAVGQASLAIEIRENDPDIQEIVSAVNDDTTRKAIECERIFLHELEGGCQVPIAGYATISDATITLKGLVASLDGSQIFKDSISDHIDNYETMAKTLAQKLLDSGAREILNEIYGR